MLYNYYYLCVKIIGYAYTVFQLDIFCLQYLCVENEINKLN